MFQGSLKDVWSLKVVSNMFQGSFKGSISTFQGSFKKASRTSFKSVSMVFRASSKGCSWKFQGWVKNVSEVFEGNFTLSLGCIKVVIMFVTVSALLTRYFFYSARPCVAAGEEGIKIKKIRNKNWPRKIFKKYA